MYSGSVRLRQEDRQEQSLGSVGLMALPEATVKKQGNSMALVINRACADPRKQRSQFALHRRYVTAPSAVLRDYDSDSVFSMNLSTTME